MPDPTPTPRPTKAPAPTATTYDALLRAIRNDGDFSTRRWSEEDCAILRERRNRGHEWGYVALDGKVYTTDDRDVIPAGAPFTALDGEWQRHCV